MDKLYIRKSFIVRALQLDEEVQFNTISGVVIGHKGDYLLTYRNGMQNICDKESFEMKYEEIKEPIESPKNGFYCISSKYVSKRNQ